MWLTVHLMPDLSTGWWCGCPEPAETRDDGHTSYGFGRRTCVGKHVANYTLFMSMATVLWAMKLECPQDESGKEVPLDKLQLTLERSCIPRLLIALFGPCF
jgi:hypothetical protein